MADEKIDLAFIGRRLDAMNEELRHLRKGVDDVRRLTLVTSEYSQRIDRRQAELASDLEVIIKMEIGGSFAHLQTSIEERLDRMEARIEQIAGND